MPALLMRRSSSPSSGYYVRVMRENARQRQIEYEAKKLEEYEQNRLKLIKKQQDDHKISSILELLDVAPLGQGKYYKAIKTRRKGFIKKHSRGKRITRHRRRN